MIPSITDIKAMERPALIAARSKIFCTPVPKLLSSPFLRGLLAFEVQAQKFGGLSEGFIDKPGRVDAEKLEARSPMLRPGGDLRQDIRT